MPEPALAAALAALGDDLKPADVLRHARALRAADTVPGARKTRAALLASYSIGFAEPFLVVAGARRGLHISSYVGAFNQFEQELGASPLHDFRPDVLVLAMRPEDVDPEAVGRFHASSGRRFADLATAMLDRLAACVTGFRTRSDAPVLVANAAMPRHRPLSAFDAGEPHALTHALADYNRRLAERVAALPGVAVWDYAGLVGDEGARRWTDPRLWALARAPVAAAHQGAFAEHLARALAAVLRGPAKCLVLDLDNTLWGGVIGDDGLAGIQLGDDWPGSAYKALQRAALNLMDRGILLAVVSKNEPDVAEQAIREHPEMLLRWEQLAAARINWAPKSTNLREIAAELNLGADALVLFDDNPVERAEVRANAPEVRVIEVPPDPLAYVEALEASGHFDQVRLSEEDRVRTELYRQERQRQVVAQQADSVEDFLAGLEMHADVGRADAATLGRIAQLVGKTNQFNLTTRRHSDARLAAMSGDPDHCVAWLRLGDRFGDLGLVAVGIARVEGDVGVVDTFLMSCRVMNREVETALMAYLAEWARGAGCAALVGEYRPTKKNPMVGDLYARLGFEPAGALDGGGTRWRLELSRVNLTWPAVIRRGSG